MAIERVISVVTTSTGGATGYSSGAITGEVVSVQYTPDATSPFATTADFAITLEKTGQAVLASTDSDGTFIKAPVQPAHDQAGDALTFSSGAPLSELVRPIVAVNDRVKVVVAQGGSGKAGSFRMTVK